MNSSISWDDYSVVLEIADAGSLSGATRLSGRSHPTLFRKLNAIEDRLGVRLFERLRTGYVLTPAGEEIVAAARDMGTLALEAERRVSGRDLRSSGTVRVTTTDTLFQGVVAAELTRLREQEPGIALDLAVSNDVLDLSRREADIALRPAASPEMHLVGRKLGVIRQAVYAPKGLNWDGVGLEKAPWIGPGSSMAYAQLQAWMAQHGYDASCVCRIDTVLGMYAVVQSGVGVAVLPAYLGDANGQLQRVGEFIEDLSTDLWLLVHPDLRHTARVRTVLDFLASSQSLKRALA